MAEPIELPFCWLTRGSKEQYVRWRSRLDESNHTHSTSQVGDVAFCQISLGSCLYLACAVWIHFSFSASTLLVWYHERHLVCGFVLVLDASSHPSNIQHQSCDDCLEVRRGNKQNCSVLCCVQQLGGWEIIVPFQHINRRPYRGQGLGGDLVPVVHNDMRTFFSFFFTLLATIW